MFDDYPLIVAANRDERYDRPSAPPAVLNSSPAILAGRDLRAGGTWLGVNEYGLLVGILNRRADDEQRQQSTTRSRGLFCLELLGLKTAAEACAIAKSHQAIYQPFTVLFADARESWSAYNVDYEIRARKLSRGLHVFSNTAEFDARTEKVNRAYGQFARLVDHLRLDSLDNLDRVRVIAKVLGDHTPGDGSNDPREAICVHGDESGTVSSSIIFFSRSKRQFQTFHCSGAPCQNAFDESLALPVR